MKIQPGRKSSGKGKVSPDAETPLEDAPPMPPECPCAMDLCETGVPGIPWWDAACNWHVCLLPTEPGPAKVLKADMSGLFLGNA